MDEQWFDEFALDWRLEGRAHRTVELYVRDLRKFFVEYPEPTLGNAKEWLAATGSRSVQRKRAQALRAFGKWATGTGLAGLEWMQRVPLVSEVILPQQTAVESDYLAALTRVRSLRDRAVIELLWSCGLRRSELAALRVEDVDIEGGFVVVRQAKSRKPRIAPLSPSATRALRHLTRVREEGALLGLSSNGIRLLLSRLGAPSAHAWRRGWAVRALGSGVSETSVRAAAGWTSGAMVSRYTKALSESLAIEEFRRIWS